MHNTIASTYSTLESRVIYSGRGAIHNLGNYAIEYVTIVENQEEHVVQSIHNNNYLC